jgi:hypothetical protein
MADQSDFMPFPEATGCYSKTTIGVPSATALKCCFPQENNTFDTSALGMEIVVLL